MFSFLKGASRKVGGAFVGAVIRTTSTNKTAAVATENPIRP